LYTICTVLKLVTETPASNRSNKAEYAAQPFIGKWARLSRDLIPDETSRLNITA
jgi:hypothetical protein